MLEVVQTTRRLRSRPRLTTRVGFVTLSSALFLTACGAAAGSTPGSSPSSGATGLLAEVESSHQLKIAITAIPPEDFQTSSGTWTGYDPDILNGFAKTLGATLAFTSLPFSASIQAVESRRDDVTINIFYTAQRAAQLAYSRAMLNYTDDVAVSESSPALTSPTLPNLSGKPIGVVSGGVEVTEAQKIPNANVVQYDTFNELTSALATGRIAAAIQPGPYFAYAKLSNPSLDLKDIGPIPASIAPPAASTRGHYALPKGSYSSGILDKLNAYLKMIECNGTEQTILNKYGMSSSEYLKGICASPDNPTGT
jgi:polar amino acid transport system substrate-binding protein